MHGEDVAFGHGVRSLVVVIAAIFVLLALSFLTPVKQREGRSFGAFTGFVVETYGFPLAIYVPTAVLGRTLLGGEVSMSITIHVVSNGLLLGGLVLMSAGWRRVRAAHGELITTGLCAWVRHPQYAGLFLITAGMLIQWPTIIAVATWPTLIVIYSRLARREERVAAARFGEAYRGTAPRGPVFVPRLGPRLRTLWGER